MEPHLKSVPKCLPAAPENTEAQDRPLYALLVAVTILLGLASRRFPHLLPPWLAKNAGDILYAVMAFWLVGLFFPALATARAALSAALFCFGIELLKFSQVPWLVAARHNRAGALVFGVGFHGSNLVCYLVGVAVATVIEKAFLTRVQRPPHREE